MALDKLGPAVSNFAQYVPTYAFAMEKILE